MPSSSRRSRPVSGTPRRGARRAAAQQPQAPDTGPDSVLRILCVDDHAVLVEGLKAQFAIQGRLRVVGRLASAKNLLAETARLQPDVVLLDIEMPGPDVFEMADRLRHMHPRARCVFLSAHVRDGYLAAAYKCGGWGYFSKADELEDMVAGIQEVAASAGGTFVMGPKVRERCRPAMTAAGGTPNGARKSAKAGPATPLSRLSPREVEVLRLIGKGRSRTQIAAELCRSVKTVDGHQDRIMKKLGISARSDLMRFAIREGFAEA
ncbi:MAG: response regulator transcription factor [Planctomycetota bacterium]|nr:MAG: response regulator transcription factor [Planctomycetota bacterium]